MSKIDKIQIGETVYNLGVNAENIEGKVPVDLEDYYNKEETNELLEDKQNKLTAGENITIDENNIISASGGTFETIYSCKSFFYNYSIGNSNKKFDAVDLEGYNQACLEAGQFIPIAFQITSSYRKTMILFPRLYNDKDLTFTGNYSDENGDIVRSTVNGDYIRDAVLGQLPSFNIWVGVRHYISTTNTDVFNPTSNYHPSTKKYVDDKVINKQDKLTAGENITIDENNVISASGGGEKTWDIVLTTYFQDTGSGTGMLNEEDAEKIAELKAHVVESEEPTHVRLFANYRYGITSFLGEEILPPKMRFVNDYENIFSSALYLEPNGAMSGNYDGGDYEPESSVWLLSIRITNGGLYYCSESLSTWNLMRTDKCRTITKQHAYTELPIGIGTPTDDRHFTTKKYVDDAISQAGGGKFNIIYTANRTNLRYYSNGSPDTTRIDATDLEEYNQACLEAGQFIPIAVTITVLRRYIYLFPTITSNGSLSLSGNYIDGDGTVVRATINGDTISNAVVGQLPSFNIWFIANGFNSNNYYTKTDIDSKIGNIESLLSEV